MRHLLASIAALALSYGLGVLQGWRWGKQDGAKDMASRIDALFKAAHT